MTELFLPPTVIYRLLDEPGIERAGPLVAALLHLRRRAAVGRQAAPRDRRLRPGDDAGLRPDRGAGVDRDAAPRGVPRRRRAGRRRAPVGVRPADARWSRVAIRGDDGATLPQGETGEICVSRRPGHEGLLQGPRADGRDDRRRLAAHRRRRLPGPPRATCTSPTAPRT